MIYFRYMRIAVRVKPNAKENCVNKLSDISYQVSVTQTPEKGKANTAVVKLLADYFDTSQSLVSLVSGATARDKLFDITFK